MMLTRRSCCGEGKLNLKTENSNSEGVGFVSMNGVLSQLHFSFEATASMDLTTLRRRQLERKRGVEGEEKTEQ